MHFPKLCGMSSMAHSMPTSRPQSRTVHLPTHMHAHAAQLDKQPPHHTTYTATNHHISSQGKKKAS